MSLDFPFLTSSTLEDVTSILRYINVSILFYSIIENTNKPFIFSTCHRVNFEPSIDLTYIEVQAGTF